MAQSMNQETIFVQTDPTFDSVLGSLTELQNQNRVKITHSQSASLQDIESNNQGFFERFTFGGLYGFARTASSVLRMCMLAATGIAPGLWPTIGKYSQQRNVAKMDVQESVFSLAYNKCDAREYWRKYDQLYPHFLIQQEIKSIPINFRISVPSMMIIFRPVGNSTEIIEINTTFTVKRRDQASTRFNSFIHVACIVRSVQEDFRKVKLFDGPFTKTLKKHLNNPFRTMEGLLNMAQKEIIFVQTDPAFDIVLNSLTELKHQDRLQVTHFQIASLQNIESNNPNLYLRSTFGGLYGFARTASSVLRMCMLAATNIDEELWPTIGPYSQQRNLEKMDVDVQLSDLPMNLAKNPADALKYWSKYDQLYPHFLIQQAIQSVPINAPISLPSMMIICRFVGDHDLTEVIEISTTFDVTRRDQASTCFSSYIHVTCIVRSVQESLMDGPFTQSLNAELLNQLPEMEGLPFDFNNLAISPK